MSTKRLSVKKYIKKIKKTYINNFMKKFSRGLSAIIGCNRDLAGPFMSVGTEILHVIINKWLKCSRLLYQNGRCLL